MQQCEVLTILTTVLAGLGGDRPNTNLAGCSARLGKKVGHRDKQNDTKLSTNETEHAQSIHIHTRLYACTAAATYIKIVVSTVSPYGSPSIRVLLLTSATEPLPHVLSCNL